MPDSSVFFAFLDTRFACAGDETMLWLSIQGYTVKVLFRGMVPSDVMLANLQLLLTKPAEHPDELLCVWEDDLDAIMELCMVPEDQRTIHFQQTEDYYLLMPGSNKRLSARDNAAHVTYICYERGSATPETCATKPFTNEVQWWLWDKFLLVHGAAVGAGGHGALVVAPSGGGKSTLALASLVRGLDFAGEDFVLVPKKGPAIAYAAYPTGNLLPDSLEILPELKPCVLTYMEYRNKYVVDLTSYGKSFKMQIPLDVMVYPIRCAAAEPLLVPTRSVQLFMKAAVSAAKQVKSRSNLDEAVKVLFARLKTLPAYEMRLSGDPLRNAECLRSFLEHYDGVRAEVR